MPALKFGLYCSWQKLETGCSKRRMSKLKRWKTTVLVQESSREIGEVRTEKCMDPCCGDRKPVLQSQARAGKVVS